MGTGRVWPATAQASNRLLPPTPHFFQEEEDTKPKPTKRKRKGSSAVGSDSD